MPFVNPRMIYGSASCLKVSPEQMFNWRRRGALALGNWTANSASFSRAFAVDWSDRYRQLIKQ